MAPKVKINRLSRRKFLGWISALSGAAILAGTFESIYSGSIFKSRNFGRLTKKRTRKIKNRQVGTQENLILNTKTNIIHYPTKKIYKYYNKILKAQIIDIENWKNGLAVSKFNKDQSGIILEKLALRELIVNRDNASLERATNTLAIAFSDNYWKNNITNWRIYDFLIKLIYLNSSIDIQNKQARFTNIITKVDFRTTRIPRRNNWIKSPTDFQNKIAYFVKNEARISEKLDERAKKFWSV